MTGNATLHFGLSHLRGDLPFTLHLGLQRYTLTPHTPHTLRQHRRWNAALAHVPDGVVTHFAGPVRMPAGPVLLRVSTPALCKTHALDRLVLTMIGMPRALRVAGLRRWLAAGRPAPAAKRAFLGMQPSIPTDLELLADIQDLGTAFEAATSLVFHHPELMTLRQNDTPGYILTTIEESPGLLALAQSILDQSTNHQNDPDTPNWVNPQPGKNWQTGDPDKTLYVWSDQTKRDVRQPLQAAIRTTKNDPTLQGQCWTVQTGVTQVTTSPAARAPRLTADAEANYTIKQLTPQAGVESKFAYDPGTAAGTISVKNWYLRWLEVNVDQYGPGGEQVTDTQSLGFVEPVDTIMAIPLPAEWSDFQFTFSPQASSAVVSYGGLGQVPFSINYDFIGMILTAVFNLAMPTLFIATGTAIDQDGTWNAVQKTVASQILNVIDAGAEGLLGDAVTQSVSLEDVLATLASYASSLLISLITTKASAALTAFITERMSEEAAESAAPVIGWIMLAIGAAADIANLIETSVEVARSPATMEISIVRTMDLLVTIEPDPRHEIFPRTATEYVITVTYEDGPAYVHTASFDPTTQDGNIQYTFADLPSGGSIVVAARFYASTGWLAGQGVTPSTPAQPNQGSTLALTFAITENLVPLSSSTTYNFNAKLIFQDGSRVWGPAGSVTAPVATVSDLDSSNVGDNLSSVTGLAHNEALSSLGYLWTASGQNVPVYGSGNDPYSGQLATFQAISTGGAPQSGLKFSGDGYTICPCIAFPPASMANPVADGFLLQPDLTTATMRLRALSLQPNQPFIVSSGQSFGQFTSILDDLAIHPAGYAVALSIATSTLQVLRLGAAVADSDAPQALLYGGYGTRPGLIGDAVAVACSADTIMVLQTTASDPQGCVAAFDVKGNPVYCFGGSSTFSLQGEGNATVVPADLSVESKGYIYVLKYLSPSSGVVTAGDYRLDIYNPNGTLLVQVQGIAAARLHVDLWRNVFTLNYEILQGSGRTEPSVALWIPSTPQGVARLTLREQS